ncbi:hypothetical protein QE152_g9411 [Popillia japonica]|uniref:Double jelly roll-like domain-containing protein n=1 Tax=Popillia japonica TaxID=7064 RepID=A0AAW1LZJ3_POPJA
MAGWCPFSDKQPTLSAGKKFSAYIPLKFFLGFAEDYNKIIINAKQELILVRSKSDDNCYKNSTTNATKKAQIEIQKIEWYMPHISISDEMRLKFMETLHIDKPIYIPFHKWELYELPSLRNTRTDIWPHKRKDNFLADASSFDHFSIENIKLYLNSENYPYNKMNLSMSNKRYLIAYQMYKSFQESYYNRSSQPLLDYNNFLNNAVYVIDCSKQNESLKAATVDTQVARTVGTTLSDCPTCVGYMMGNNVGVM